MDEHIQTKKALLRIGTVILIALIASAIAAAAFALYSPEGGASINSLAGSGTAAPTLAKIERVSITVDGMSCPTSCPAGIVAMLNRTRGVLSADASFENKEANVEFDPTAVSREKIVEAITNMGYRASIKQ